MLVFEVLCGILLISRTASNNLGVSVCYETDHYSLHFTLVVTYKCTTVILNDASELSGGKLAIGYPTGQLVVPHAIVPSHELTVGLSLAHNLITLGKREDTLLRLRRIPFHTVCRSKLPEISVIVEDSDIRRI